MIKIKQKQNVLWIVNMTKEEKVPLRRRVNVKQHIAFMGSVKK